MEVQDCIKERRSTRSYQDKKIELKIINKILDAAICAPSGKNGQPWRFKIVTDKALLEKISELSIYKEWMKTAPCNIVVYLNKEKSYNYVKDVQSCGAAIQNILLTAHSMGISSCWIGEILNKESQVSELLSVDTNKHELMAVIILGYGKDIPEKPAKNSFESFLL